MLNQTENHRTYYVYESDGWRAHRFGISALSVAPEYQRQGVVTALVKEGHRIACEIGYEYSVVFGSENYYPKFGYVPAAELGIKPSFDVPSENFIAYKLKDSAPSICGILKYAKEFGIE